MEEVFVAPQITSNILSLVPYKSIATIASNTKILPEIFSSVASNYEFWNNRIHIHLGLKQNYPVDVCKTMEYLFNYSGWEALLTYSCSNDLIEAFDLCIELLKESTAPMQDILVDAMNVSIESGSIGTFNRLIDLGIFSMCDYTQQALELACQFERIEMVRILLYRFGCIDGEMVHNIANTTNNIELIELVSEFC